jgi:hypothetical protein
MERMRIVVENDGGSSTIVKTNVVDEKGILLKRIYPTTEGKRCHYKGGDRRSSQDHCTISMNVKDANTYNTLEVNGIRGLFCYKHTEVLKKIDTLNFKDHVMKMPHPPPPVVEIVAPLVESLPNSFPFPSTKIPEELPNSFPFPSTKIPEEYTPLSLLNSPLSLNSNLLEFLNLPTSSPPRKTSSPKRRKVKQ